MGPCQPAVVVEPTDLVFQHDQVGHGRRVERLVLAGVVDCGFQGQEGRNPAPRALELRAFLQRIRAFDGSGGEDGDPQAAVGAERLLRGEVIGIGLGDVDRQDAGTAGCVHQGDGALFNAAGDPLDRCGHAC